MLIILSNKYHIYFSAVNRLVYLRIFPILFGKFKVRRDGMEHQFLSVEEFNRQLQQWNGQQIKITKHEMDDVDKIVMHLQDISYDLNTRRIDDYVPRYNLLLKGDGRIETLASMSNQPLPASVYEIPLENNTLYEYDGEKFFITTERGVYKIEQVYS